MRLHDSGGAPLTWRAVAAGLRADAALRAQLTTTLQACPHAAYFFETCPVSRATADTQPFAFVLQDSPALAHRRSDPSPLQGCFQPGEAISTFDNRGRDAVLVSPSPTSTPHSAGTHLAVFLREAPTPLIDALWHAVGVAVESWWQAHPEPVWVSTSGLGVSWLHVRLDQRPKYYSHRPFRAWPAP